MRLPSRAYDAPPWWVGGGVGSSGSSQPSSSCGSAVAAVLALLGVAAAHRGQQALDRAQRDRTYEALIDPATGALLDDAHDEFARGNDLLSNPVMFPFRFLPVLGRQLRAADRLTDNAADASEVARDTVDEVRDDERGAHTAGPGTAAPPRPAGDGGRRLRTGGSRRSTSPTTRRSSVRSTTCGPRWPTSGARRSTASTGRRRCWVRCRACSTARPISCWGANNAEMRAGSGMFLSATTLTTEGGHLDIGDVRPTNRLVLDEGVETPPELAQNYPWLDTGKDFRNLALSPQFAQSAEIASRMWPQVPKGEEVDGVLAVDAEALWHIMKVTGPVTVNGTTYTPKTVRYQLLNGQYKQFPKDQGDRTDQLGEVARAVFDELESGDWKVGKLATALIDSVAGRHLLLWSADETEQAGWEAASADGASRRTRWRSRCSAEGPTSSTTTSTWRRRSPRRRRPTAPRCGSTSRCGTARRRRANRSTWSGPNTEGLAEGEYTGIVAVNVPKAARSVRFEGGAYSTLVGTDGPTQTQGRYVRILRGDQARADPPLPAAGLGRPPDHRTFGPGQTTTVDLRRPRVRGREAPHGRAW